MLSGIGPSDELRKHNIPVQLDLPGVGSNLIDHPVVDVYFKNKHDDSPKHINPKSVSDFFRFLRDTAKYYITRTGAMATNVRT